MDHKTVFATNLKRYMELNGKSRRDLCTALGYSYYTVTDWVKGKKMPRMDKVEQLANYFGCLKSDLIEDKKEKPAENDELFYRKMEFIEQVKKMSAAELDKLDQILRIIEDTK